MLDTPSNHVSPIDAPFAMKSNNNSDHRNQPANSFRLEEGMGIRLEKAMGIRAKCNCKGKLSPQIKSP